MNITEADIDRAVAIQRAAGTGTMVLKGKALKPADVRWAQRVMAEATR